MSIKYAVRSEKRGIIMLNKLRCFMWGHEFTTFYKFKCSLNHVATYEGSFTACKHCGKVKE